jgi:hypothetical protein
VPRKLKKQLKANGWHTGLAGKVCKETGRVRYDDGTVECRRCGRTGGPFFVA